MSKKTTLKSGKYSRPKSTAKEFQHIIRATGWGGHYLIKQP